MRKLGLDGATSTRELCADGLSRWTSAQLRNSDGHQRWVIRQVAPELSANDAFAARWAASVAQNASCTHPSLFPILDWGVWNGRLCTAREDGPVASLSTLISPERRRGGLSACAAVHVGCSALGLLEHVAGKYPGTLHLDIRPERVHVDPQGRVLLTEFGLWTLLAPAELTRRRFDCGEVHHLAPEVVQSLSADARSDLFSLGAVLFELLSGHKAFSGATQLAAAMEISAGRRRKLSEVSSAPAVLCEVVERLLAHRPEDRYQSAHEALEAFVPLMELRETGVRELREGVLEAGQHTPGAAHPALQGPQEGRARTNGPDTPRGATGGEAPGTGWGRGTQALIAQPIPSGVGGQVGAADARLRNPAWPVPATQIYQVSAPVQPAAHQRSGEALDSRQDNASLRESAGSSAWDTSRARPHAEMEERLERPAANGQAYIAPPPMLSTNFHAALAKQPFLSAFGDGNVATPSSGKPRGDRGTDALPAERMAQQTVPPPPLLESPPSPAAIASAFPAFASFAEPAREEPLSSSHSASRAPEPLSERAGPPRVGGAFQGVRPQDDAKSLQREWVGPPLQGGFSERLSALRKPSSPANFTSEGTAFPRFSPGAARDDQADEGRAPRGVFSGLVTDPSGRLNAAIVRKDDPFAAASSDPIPPESSRSARARGIAAGVEREASARQSDSGYRPYVPAHRASDKWRDPSGTVFQPKAYAKGNTLRPGTQMSLPAIVALAVVFGSSAIGLVYLLYRMLR